MVAESHRTPISTDIISGHSGHDGIAVNVNGTLVTVCTQVQCD
jgi:hypothetical protein